MQIGEFWLNLQYIFVRVVKSSSWAKGSNDEVSRDYCYLYVNIIRSYICLGSNHQLWSRGPTMFAVNIRSSAWFQAWFIRSYIQTAESRSNVVEGTAQETVWEDGDLVWRRGSTRHSSISAAEQQQWRWRRLQLQREQRDSAAAAAGASAHRQRQQRDSARVARGDVWADSAWTGSFME